MNCRGAKQVLLVAALCAATTAHADKREAKRDVEAGSLAYKLGHFQEALDAFSRAYEAFPAPLLLFDLGQCNRELGNYEKALFFLRGYLHENPKAKNRKLVEDLIAETDRKLAAQQQEARKQAEVARQREEAEAAEQFRASAEVSAPLVTVPESPVIDRLTLTAQAKSARRELYSGIGIAAVGAVAIGVGAYLGSRASANASTISQLSSSGGTWTSSSQATYLNGMHDAVAADVLFAVGGTAMVTGGVFALLGWTKLSSANARLSLAVAPTTTGGRLALAWSY